MSRHGAGSAVAQNTTVIIDQAVYRGGKRIDCGDLRAGHPDRIDPGVGLDAGVGAPHRGVPLGCDREVTARLDRSLGEFGGEVASIGTRAQTVRSRSGSTDRYRDPGQSADQHVRRAGPDIVVTGQQVRRGRQAGLGQRLDVVDVQPCQGVVDTVVEAFVGEKLGICMGRSGETAGHRDTHTGQVGDHFAKRGVLTTHAFDVRHTQLIEPQNVLFHATPSLRH